MMVYLWSCLIWPPTCWVTSWCLTCLNLTAWSISMPERLTLTHTGHLTVSHASCLVQQLALWPASHLALHVWDICHHHALLDQVLSCLWVPPCNAGICNYLPAGGFSYTKNLSISGSPCLWEQQVILSLCGWPGQAVRCLAARALGPVELSQALPVLGMWRHGLALWPALVLDNCCSWRPHRESASLTYWRMDPPCPPWAYFTACEVQSGCFTYFVWLTLSWPGSWALWA